jgi:hypothetical protein
LVIGHRFCELGADQFQGFLGLLARALHAPQRRVKRPGQA